MNRWIIPALVASLAVTVPALAQEAGPPRSNGHAHGEHGHDDMDDVRAVLRLLAVYQARHHAQHGRFAASLQELGFPEPRQITLQLSGGGRRGFAAVSGSATEECAYFEGTVAPPREFIRRAGELVCRSRH
ncbi:MAG TPA: hypothetical protein VGB24_19850 [Longimicrobium sp.]|jgi:hypothetical protein|uniref:hypothetical protein n=1 Tax=Longimicrobium sp. TaxID=2029185 RepID=UPI002ED9F774